MLREQFGTTTTLYHNRHYNRRGQLFDVRLGTSSSDEWSWNRGALRMYFNSDYSDYLSAPTYANNNGNLYRLDHFVPTSEDASQWSMAVDYYSYDSLNRVTGIAEQSYWSNGAANYNTFSQDFNYDRFANRLVSSATGTGVPNPGFKINGANNRLIAPTDVDGNQPTDKMQYDAAGNLVKDVHTQAGTGTRTYDAENRMLTAVGLNGQTQSYVYDADGRRTRRILHSGNEVWWQVFGLSGELVAEYQLVSGSPVLKKEYGYRSGQLLVIAEAVSSNCQWLVTDALGTPRILADQTGSLSGIKRRDYLPFGEEVLAGIGHRAMTNGYGTATATQPRQQFTGKERDSETGLDYFEARYYGSLYGRFTSPDEFTGGPTELFAEVAAHNPTFYAELAEPQSLNKYAYCLNNPFRYIDPDGHQTMMADLLNPVTRYVTTEAAKGVGKSVLNTLISIDNAGNTVARALGFNVKDTELYQPSNAIQAKAMGITDKELVLAGFLGGRGPANVMMTEAKQGTVVTAAEAAGQAKGGFLVRLGKGPETAEQLAAAAARAEQNGFPHGVSTNLVNRISGTDKAARSAPRAEVEKHFTVTKTGKRPKHHTVHLPKPVTPEVADKFNELFKPKEN